MLIATRDDGPHAHAVHYAPHTPPRTLASRFTGAVQLVGSLVGIPLALVGGYSTYHATFSPEGKCQVLRANIVSMLDKKTDATTLRLLMQKDVVTFERECGAVDADAAAAFKNLLGSEKSAVAHRVTPVEKVEAIVAQPPAKADKTERAQKLEKHEPVKREAVKQEALAKEAVAKLESPKQSGAPQHAVAAPPLPAEKALPAPQAEKPVDKAVDEPKPAETAAVQPEKASVDASWVASVRDALRESASQPPAAETTSEIAPNPGAPIDISPAAQVARRGEFTPPAEVGPGGSRPSAPRPPGLIPSAN
jgi:hypothetical protein